MWKLSYERVTRACVITNYVDSSIQKLYNNIGT